AHVEAHGQHPFGRDHDVVTTAEGRFEIGALEKNEYRLVATSGGMGYAHDMGEEMHRKSVDLGEGEHKTGVDFVLARTDHSISGTAVGPDQKRVASATITAFPENESGFISDMNRRRTTYSGNDGRFLIDHLAKGWFRLQASHPGLAQTELGHVAADASVR